MVRLQAQAARLKMYVYAPPASYAWCASRHPVRSSSVRGPLLSHPPPRRSAANLSARFPLCRTFMWSGDYELAQKLARSDLATMDGDAADYYIVPFLSKCYYNKVARYRMDAMGTALLDVVRFETLISYEHPARSVTSWTIGSLSRTDAMVARTAVAPSLLLHVWDRRVHHTQLGRPPRRRHLRRCRGRPAGRLLPITDLDTSLRRVSGPTDH